MSAVGVGGEGAEGGVAQRYAFEEIDLAWAQCSMILLVAILVYRKLSPV